MQPVVVDTRGVRKCRDLDGVHVVVRVLAHFSHGGVEDRLFSVVIGLDGVHVVVRVLVHFSHGGVEDRLFSAASGARQRRSNIYRLCSTA